LNDENGLGERGMANISGLFTGSRGIMRALPIESKQRNGIFRNSFKGALP
jgi:hypothetical protein